MKIYEDNSLHYPVALLRGDYKKKKNRQFKDNRQIGEGGSSSNQKFKIILISDIFWRGGGSETFVKILILVFFIFFESCINILSLVIRFFRTFLCNYYLILSLYELLSMKMKSAESLPIKERITKKRYQNCSYKICTKKYFLSKFR